MNRALFLDRDGTILKELTEPDASGNIGYLLDPSRVQLIDGAADAIAAGRSLGFRIIIITNQSAFARGWLTEETFNKINQTMYDKLLGENKNAVVDALYYSPYYAEGVVEKYKMDSDQRKPGIGMLLDAQKDFDLDLSSSYLIGDAYSDIKCAENAGTKKILVRTGYGKTAYKKCIDESLKIDFIADNILDAVKWIEKNDAFSRIN